MARAFWLFRVTVLLLVLVGVAAWGISSRRQREARTSWQVPLQVAIVLMAEEPVALPVQEAWSQGADALGAWVSTQFERYRGQTGMAPIRFEVLAPVLIPEPPPFRPAGDGLWERLEHRLTLERFLFDLHRRGNVNPRAYDARIYVHLRGKAQRRAQWVEGVGEAGGVLGLVRAPADEQDLTLALSAVAHELFHCLGATDKYDSAGHAHVPDGLVDPEAVPLFPQEEAEIMVGGTPMGPGRGVVPRSLDELGVGPLTASELHWTTVR